MRLRRYVARGNMIDENENGKLTAQEISELIDAEMYGDSGDNPQSGEPTTEPETDKDTPDSICGCCHCLTELLSSQ